VQTRLSVLAIFLLMGFTDGAEAQVTTAQSNNLRTSANLHEKRLTPANVNVAGFGKLFSRTVDGDIFAQPLYVPALDIKGLGKRNVVFVATEHDSVYAFDVDGGADVPLWKTSFLTATSSSVPAKELHCPFIKPEVGITPTPVIDLASGTIYVLARTKEDGQYMQRLHALDLTTGAEKFGGPVLIKAAVKGSGVGATDGQLFFDGLRENPRAALLLVGGQVYLSWGSSCDVGPYHGWVMAYDARTLTQTAVFNTSPDGGEAGIWQADAGPAADDNGNIFVVTGNGDFNVAPGAGRDYGDSVLRLNLEAKSLSVRDYFTPFNQKELNTRDLDLGSQGPVLLPDQSGPHSHLLVVGGKEGKLYVLDRDHLGKHGVRDDSQIIQTIEVEGALGAAAYWNGHVFYTDYSYVTRDFAMEGGHLILKNTTSKMAAPAATPIVSSDGTEDGLLWVVATKEWNESSSDKPFVLHVYDAKNITHELYNTEQRSTRDRGSMTVRFAMPTVADGHVFVGARGRLDVYGLLTSHE